MKLKYVPRLPTILVGKKVFTVVSMGHEEGCIVDVASYNVAYRSLHDAVQAVEADAYELFEAMNDPNDGEHRTWLGLEWNDSMTRATTERYEGDNLTIYVIQEATVE